MDRQDLVSLIRQNPRRRRPVRRRARQPDAIRLGYFKALRTGILADMREAVRRHVLPLLPRFAALEAIHKIDADDSEPINLHEAIDKARSEIARKWSSANIARVVQPYAHKTANLSRDQLVGLLKDEIGVDVFLAQPWLEGEVRAWTAENVALIKTIPGNFFPDLEKKLIDAVHRGDRAESMTDQIKTWTSLVENREDVAEWNATRIARDQVGKLYAGINERNQKDLGVTRYVWEGMADNRERDSHEERNGKVFSWEEDIKPQLEAYGLEPDTIDGHAGTPIMCRCFASPLLDDIFGEATGEQDEAASAEDAD